jgi:thioredoxin-related protein
MTPFGLIRSILQACIKRMREFLFTLIFIAFSAVSIPTIGQISSQNAPGVASSATRKESALPIPADLRSSAQAAQRKNEPLVILLSLPGCPWCELLRRNYLLPMRSEGLQAFQWNVQDRQQRIINFQGEPSTGAQLSKSYAYQTTPTVLFLNAQGDEIAPRIEGVASVDLIGAVLDERIAQAREQLKKR